MKKIKIFLAFFGIFGFFIHFSHAQISGTVFRDFNGDGIKQSGEPGKDRIEVYAYSNSVSPQKDVLVGQTTTGADGSYTITPTSYPVRLEFVIPDGFCNMASDQDYPSANLTPGSNTSEVQIANNGETHNFGIVYPFDFSTDNNPRTFAARFINGDPLGGGSTGLAEAVVSFHYHDKGIAPNDGRGGGTGDNVPFEVVAIQEQLGTVHGMAYSRQGKKLFASAFLKRHAGLGPLGGGGIYWMDPNPPYDHAANLEFMDLDALGFPTSDEINPYDNNPPGSSAYQVMFSPVIGTNSDRGLPANKAQPNHDRAAWTQIGKLSLGDLDISEDGRYLYVVNLYDRKLYEIDLTDAENPVAPTLANAATKIHSYQIPDPCNNPENGEYRPFALKVARGKVFVGVTCSGQDADGNRVTTNNSDMTGNVFEFDLSTHTFDPSPMISFDFSYRNSDKAWSIWSSSWIGSWEEGIPLLSDIDFDNNGNVLLGIMDLRGNMMGQANYSINTSTTSTHSIATVGELLNAVRDPSSPTCSYSIQTNPEFYNDNLWHTESSQGALTVHHTSDFDGAMSTFLDPCHHTATGGNAWNAGGVMLYNNQNGSQVYSDGYELFYGGISSGNFAKANGLGDIETLEVIPPIEIGNIVWLDWDEDGIQDADEEGIEGVIVELVKNGQVVASTTTDNLGTYYFNFTNTNNGEGPEPNTDYVIRISSTQFFNGSGSGPLAIKNLTLSDESGNGMSNWSDNDASEVSGIVQISMTTGNPGENNHSYDFGFTNSYDWGDLPSPQYATNNAENGPRHVIIPGLMIGTSVDEESDGQPNSDATGDGDDEDGITFPELIIPGTTLDLAISTTNTTGITSYFEAWIDWNNDGDFDDADEMIFDLDDSGGSFPDSVHIPVPVDAAINALVGARFRISQTDNMTPFGLSTSGEIEDYLIKIGGYDYGDLPDIAAGTGMGNYNTFDANNGPRHLIIPGLLLGSTIDAELDGFPDTDANGDDLDHQDDEDGVTFPAKIGFGETFDLPISITNTSGSTAYLEAWIDWNGDGDFDESNEMIADLDDGSVAFPATISVTVPNDAAQGIPLGVRFRLSLTDNMTPYGQIESGEIEDYVISPVPIYDFGDLPDENAGTSTGNYRTQQSDNGPRHLVIPNFYIGNSIDFEPDGQQTADTSGDGFDEDGFTFPSTIILRPGVTIKRPFSVVNGTGQTAYLKVWIDWNGDGDFDDANELVAFYNDSGTGFPPYLTFNVPAAAKRGQPIGFRARLSNDANMPPNGLANSGEVEDYLITVECTPVCMPSDSEVNKL